MNQTGKTAPALVNKTSAAPARGRRGRALTAVPQTKAGGGADIRAEPRPSPEDIIYEDVYDAIMEHRLPPGTKLAELALCDIYGAARHAIRKVLARLAAEGLVELEAHRGAFIASPSPREAEDMFEMRRIVEHALLDKVAASASAEQLQQLQEMVAQERDAYRTGDRGRWIRLSAQFHLELARIAANGWLHDTLRRLVSRTTLLIAKVDAPGQNACSFDEHQQVLDALAARNVALAQSHMAHHLQHCEARIKTVPPPSFDLRAALGKT